MLHIIYRTCGGEDTREQHKKPRHYKGEGPAPYERTEWFDKRVYFKSFAQELDENVKVTVVYDGDAPTLKDYILKNWVEKKPQQFKFHQIYMRDNLASLRECYRLADEDKESEFFYFLEDDYLHRPGWLKVLKEGFNLLPQTSLITLYDHKDRYTRSDDATQGQEHIKMSESTYWRTAESTTCTVAMRRILWEKVREVFIQGGLADREVFRFLIPYGVRLWQPMPGFSTHDHILFMSPFVDWQEVCKNIQMEENAVLTNK